MTVGYINRMKICLMNRCFGRTLFLVEASISERPTTHMCTDDLFLTKGTKKNTLVDNSFRINQTKLQQKWLFMDFIFIFLMDSSPK